MALICAVTDCENPAVVREIYLKPGGHGKEVDEVCSWHTGRNPGLQMIGRERVPGTVEYQTGEE